eukprot:TRINITY_DN11768_c0_g1_i1.p1 TRINITY_DN11768_c0_g1~~TRINITY_DN11768_c0_g1_i1.p1  ORF type:complete len:224 (-),score=17.18 TRINITY_DN11768_c0_g1_i1:87-758(-)
MSRWIESVVTSSQSKSGYEYLLYRPNDPSSVVSSDKSRTWPAILFLHGAGENYRGVAINLLIQKFIEAINRQDVELIPPCFIIAPQAKNRGWNNSSLKTLVDEVVQHYPIDSNRLYGTGLSMGGYGIWSLAADYPQLFAAIIPICGGGDTSSAKRLKDLPTWVFHSRGDPIVPHSQSDQMVKALRAAGAEHVEFTTYEDDLHDSWTQTYQNQNTWSWLFKQKK